MENPAQKTASTINPEEVEKFSRMAEDWWNPEGKFKPLHKFNPLRVKYIKEKMITHFNLDADSQKPLSGLKILDIGCGGGLLSAPLSRLGADVTGIDASEQNIKTASAYAMTEDLTIEYLATTAEDLCSQNRQFDVVLNMEVIEHVEDAALFMQKSAEMLKPGGLMFVATLNRNAKSFLMAIVGAEYVMRWLPRGTHDWRKFFRPHEINNYFEDNDIRLIESTGVKYSLLKDEFSLDKNLDVNFIMVGKKI